MIFKNLYLSYSMISNWEPGTLKRTVSIKRHDLNFFKKSLSNVLYDLKNQGLNALTSVSYNRVMRVLTWVLNVCPIFVQNPNPLKIIKKIDDTNCILQDVLVKGSEKEVLFKTET